MRKRRLTDVSSDDYTENKRVLITPILGTVHGSIEIKISGDTADEYNEEECASSVGSNHPIGEVITLSEDDDGEVESRLSKIDDSVHEFVAGNGSQTTNSQVTAFRSPVIVEDCFDEESIRFEKYGSMIVDDNGFLVGEFKRLDEELWINIMADS